MILSQRNGCFHWKPGALVGFREFLSRGQAFDQPINPKVDGKTGIAGESAIWFDDSIECSFSFWIFPYFPIWRFPEMGVPHFIIHFRLGFSIINHPFCGFPVYGNPQDVPIVSQCLSHDRATFLFPQDDDDMGEGGDEGMEAKALKEPKTPTNP